jgi:hypothetical protein
MKKRHFIDARLIPPSVVTSTDPIRELEDAGLLRSINEELQRSPDSVARCEAGRRGLYLWIEYPDEPKDVSAFTVLLLLVYYLGVFALLGLALSYLDAWALGGQGRRELFVTRGLFFGGLATLLMFVFNRFDRVLFVPGFLICSFALLLSVGVPLVLLVIHRDVLGLTWLIILAFLHRAALTEWS